MWTMAGEHLKIIKLLNICILNSKRRTLTGPNIKMKEKRTMGKLEHAFVIKQEQRLNNQGSNIPLVAETTNYILSNGCLPVTVIILNNYVILLINYGI